jgi:hypothetical protein
MTSLRNWDNWLRYQDNDGNPLHGCIEFMVRDGNTVADIYDSDGTALDNPQLTDYYGRTAHQVFVDKDVTAYFFKYIGNGTWNTQTDIDTSDVSKWSLQYTSENALDVRVSVTTDAVPSVPDMTALRSTDPDGVPEIDGKKVVTLLGYNEIGDKEPVNYVWDPESTAFDDGGAVIKNDDLSTGRWIMVQPTEHCDSRHFGVFPSDSSNMLDQNYGISRLFEYCAAKGIRPFFNGTEDYRWFKYSNVNLACPYIDVSDGTYFYDTGSNTIQGDWNGKPYFYNGNTDVLADTVSTDWNARTYSGYNTAYVYKSSGQKDWQDAKVYVMDGPMYGFNFDSCEIVSDGLLGSDNVSGINNTFVDCRLEGPMFVTSGDYSASLVGLCTGCEIDPDDFRDEIRLYKEIRQTSDSNPVFDYRDFENVGKPYTNYSSNKITSPDITVINLNNGFDTMVTLDDLGGQVTGINLVNVKGYYRLPSNCKVTVKDSDVKIRFQSGDAVEAFASTITLDDNYTLDNIKPSIEMHSGVLDGTALSDPYVFGTFNAHGTVIKVPVKSEHLYAKACTFAEDLWLVPYEGVSRTVTFRGNSVTVNRYITATVDSCEIEGTLYITEVEGNALVDGLYITNCTSNTTGTPFIIGRSGTMYDDSLQKYKFENNTGFLSETGLSNVPVEYYGNEGHMTRTSGSLCLWVITGVGGVLGSFYDDTSKYFCTVQLFTIGTENVATNVDVMLENISTSPGGWTNAPLYAPSFARAHVTDTAKNPNGGSLVPDLEHYGGSIWKLRNFVIGYEYLTENGSTFNVKVRQAGN